MLKKRRHIGQNTNGTDATEGANANSNVNLGSLDPTTMTIQQALEFQQQHKLGIEQFTSVIANKMKF